MTELPVKFDINAIQVEFDPDGGGFPSRIYLNEHKGNKTLLLENCRPPLTIKLDDGRLLSPFIHGKCAIRRYRIEGGAERIEFNNLAWRDRDLQSLENFKMSLRHEFWPDGTAFSSAFFTVEDNHAPGINGFELNLPLELDAFDNVRWGMFPRPLRGIVEAIMQTGAVSRFISAGVDQVYDGQIVPMFNFNCFRKNAPGVYLEFFMEGQNSLSGKASDNYSTVKWNGNKAAAITWNFQKNPARSVGRPWQWQNQWGWLITKAPVKRHFPPLKMYHYIDKHQIYPDAKEIDKLMAADPDLLIMHDPWRLDPQNGGFPYEPEQFEYLVNKAHASKIPVAVYIRGTELSGFEESLDWFDALMTKGVDGLYMDSGGPIGENQAPNERFQGGRIPFRRHFLKLRRYRERIGPDGVFFSHTGSSFTGVGMTGGNIDGYVSGEGERGILVKGRMEHEYFSEAYVVPGTMWTAAFPEYGSARMVPFMAAAGQAPHVPLGRQYVSSSLSHHREPGVNDVYIRPLWKLWGIFRKERNLAVFNDYNCYGTLMHANPHIGGYLMVAEDKQSALLIMTNFSEKAQTADIVVDWKQVGFDHAASACWKFMPTVKTPGCPVKSGNDHFSAEIEGWGVVGWLLTQKTDGIEKILKAYAKPYPEMDAADLAHLAKVKRQRKLREQPQPSLEWFLKVEVPEKHALAHEDSMYWDLYDNTFELGVFDDAGVFSPLGWIGKHGFVKTKPAKEDYIMPGFVSSQVALHEILSPGHYKLGIRSMHGDNSFYSFIVVHLSSDRDFTQAYTIEFMNEIEPDRAFVRWESVLTVSR